MENVSLTQSGNVLYDKMCNCVDANDKLILDMEGVSSMPSIFLNMSFGQFLDKFGVVKLLKTERSPVAELAAII